MSDASFDLSGSNWSKLQDVLIEALERPPEGRAAFLLQACGPNAALHREAESLLDAHTDSGDFLEQLDPGQIGSLLDLDDDAWVDRDVGPYRIIRPLGRGGMGVVYLAHDSRLERRVAVKLLPTWLAADRMARRQLVTEARAAAALDHPNIGVIHEIGETDDGHPFIAMAYYDGETLAARIRRERLPVGDAIRLIGQIARGLGAAHARGCVHCDVKPSNILVISPGPQSPEGSIVKIVDFGIARYLEDTAVEGRRHAGTAAYLAPERTRGEPAAIRTDLWSMGVVLYEMLTGRLPFRTGDDRTLVDAIRHDELVPMENLRPDVPPMLDEIVRRCLRKDADERYADAAALLGDLNRLDESRPSGSRPERPSGARHEGRLAVLALRNLSPESGLDYFAVGITQELVARLSRLRGVRVIGGATSLHYAESGKRIAAIGLELGVSTVLAGTRCDAVNVGIHRRFRPHLTQFLHNSIVGLGARAS
jgi:serine/threonine-protein kinase